MITLFTVPTTDPPLNQLKPWREPDKSVSRPQPSYYLSRALCTAPTSIIARLSFKMNPVMEHKLNVGENGRAQCVELVVELAASHHKVTSHIQLRLERRRQFGSFAQLCRYSDASKMAPLLSNPSTSNLNLSSIRAICHVYANWIGTNIYLHFETDKLSPFWNAFSFASATELERAIYMRSRVFRDNISTV